MGVQGFNTSTITSTIPIVSVSSNTIGIVLSFHSIRNFILLEDGCKGIAFPITSPTETDDIVAPPENWSVTQVASGTGASGMLNGVGEYKNKLASASRLSM